MFELSDGPKKSKFLEGLTDSNRGYVVNDTKWIRKWTPQIGEKLKTAIRT